jgi:hypothetical protein
MREHSAEQARLYSDRRDLAPCSTSTLHEPGASRSPLQGLLTSQHLLRESPMTTRSLCKLLIAALLGLLAQISAPAMAQRTVKPVLHGSHWMAITGKPLAATAGALTFNRGGNAVDAACAMLAATSTMWDTLGWGGETQALIYNPHTGKVQGINALGVAPSGATVEFFRKQGMVYPPEYGPLAAVTPGTPGGLMVMLSEYGTLSLAEVLAPAMQMAKGYPIEEVAGRQHGVASRTVGEVAGIAQGVPAASG